MLGCFAIGLAIEGTLHVSICIQNMIHHPTGAQWETAVNQQRSQSLFRSVGFKQQQGPQLGVAVLLNDVTELMFLYERFHACMEREAANSQVIGWDIARGKYV